MNVRPLSFFVVMLFFVSSCTLFQKAEPPQPPPVVNQWAISASASDAYGGIYGGNRDDQSPYAATGEPDVLKCEDSQMAWTASREDNGVQWLELGYEKEVYVSGVNIKESFGPGAVTKVEIMNNELGAYTTLWEGKDKNKICPGTLQLKYEAKEGNITKSMTPFLSDKVKITLDTDVKNWNEIDAVELVGYEQQWYMYNSTLFVDNSNS
jgi:hypothetical protein